MIKPDPSVSNWSFKNIVSPETSLLQQPRDGRKSILQTRVNFSTDIKPRSESRVPKRETSDAIEYTKPLVKESEVALSNNMQYSTALDEARSRAEQNKRLASEDIVFRERSRSRTDPSSVIRNPLAVRPSFVRNSQFSTNQETPMRQSNSLVKIDFITNQNDGESKISRNRISMIPNKPEPFTSSEPLITSQPLYSIQSNNTYYQMQMQPQVGSLSSRKLLPRT